MIKHCFTSGNKGSGVFLALLFGLLVISENLNAQTLGTIIVSVDENQTDIVEGESAQFILTNDAAILSPLTVNINVTEIGDFIIDSAPTFWQFSGDTRSETFLIPTMDDATEESAIGKIQVHIRAGAGYNFSIENVAEVKVRDNDASPYFQISTPKGKYDEGEIIPFSVYSTTVVTTNQTIAVDLQQNRNFIDSSNLEFQSRFPNYSASNSIIQLNIPAGQFKTSFNLPILNNDVVDSDGYINAIILDQESLQNTSEQVTINLLDNDSFIVSISTSDTTITEGELASFTLTSSRIADKIRTINLNVTESNDFINSQVPNSVSILSGTTSQTFSILTDDDSNNDPDTGTIMATLENGVGYTFDPLNNSVSISVSDNDPLPVIRISSLLATSQEGSRAFFTLHSDRTASFSYPINLRFAENGNFFQSIPTGTKVPNTTNEWQVTMRSGYTQTPAYVLLLDNDNYESDGSITASLLPGDDYVRHNSDNEQTVTIINNDTKPVVSVSGSIATGYTLPTVIEGEAAIFTFTLDKPSSIPITVNVQMIAMGNFTIGTLVDEILISADSTTATFEVPISEDDIANAGEESSLEATILSGTDYDIAQNSNVHINIVDNEPELSITASTSEIVEGTDAIFSISSTFATATTRTIQVNITQSGDFLTNGEQIATTLLQANEIEATLNLSTTDDTIDEAEGMIIAELISHPNLVVNPNSNFSITIIMVNDNDAPMFSLGDPVPVIEGQDLAVTFVAASAPAFDTLVHISVSGTDNVIAGFTPTIFLFRSGQTTDTLYIQTRIDSRKLPERNISVTINPDQFQSGSSPDYSVDPLNSSKVYSVADLEYPFISIHSPRISWATEGTTFQFELFASSAPVFDLIIKLSVQEYADAESDPLPSARSYNYLSDPTEIRTVVLEAGRISTSFAVETVDDYNVLSNAQIIVTIRSGDQYQVFPSPSNRARAVVQNNDFRDLASAPLLSVSAEQSSYVEGTPVTIVIESSIAFPLVQSVFLDLSEEFGTNIIVGNKSYIVQFDVGSDRETVTFQTREDFSSGDHEISATLTPYRDNIRYLISNTNGRIEIPILGIEPQVQLGAITPTISEGGVAEFELSLQPSYKYNVPIALNISGDEGLIGSEFNSTIIVPANQTTWKFEVPIQDNQGVDSDRTLTVALEPVAVGETQYIVSEVDNSVTITVLDNEPILSLFSLPSTAITEGDIAEFVILADRPLLRDKMITYEISEVGDFTSQVDHFIMLRSGESSAKVEVTTSDDSIGEENGFIKLRINDDTMRGYTVDSAHAVTSVPVLDNDEPVISVTSNREYIVEGTDTGHFSLYSTNPLAQDITVNLRINVAQNVLDYSRITSDNLGLSLNSGTFDGVLSIPQFTPDNTPTWTSITAPIYSIQLFTIDDAVISNTEEVSIELLTGTGYKLAESFTTSSIEVLDNDEFEIAVTALSSTIEEGAIAEFQLTSNQVVIKDLSINLDVTFEGDFFNRVSGPDTELISSGQSTKLYRVGTQIDNQFETNGSVSVMIRPGSGYYPNSDAAVSIIKINDDDEPPGFSILADSTRIIEGDHIDFTIITTELSQTKRSIEVTLSDGTEDYLAVGPLVHVEIDAGASIERFQVNTIDDNIHERDGTIYARISDSSVNVSTQNGIASIIVQDNDAPPEITISRKSTTNAQIVEGSDAMFTLTANRQTGHDLNIVVEATQTNSEWLNETPDANGKYTKQILLPAGEVSVDFNISTEGDRVDENDGQIITWIRTGEDYTVSGAQRSAWVEVNDDDAPITLTITRNSAGSVSEGSPVEFVINAFQSDENTFLNPTQLGLARNLPINIEVKDNTNLGNGRFLTHPVKSVVTINRGNDAVIYTIATDDDAVDEEDGEIILSLLPGDGYVLGKNHSVDSLNVVVTDNDEPPLIRFRHYGYTFVEGNEVFFEFEPDSPSAFDLTVNFFVEDETRELLAHFLNTNLLDRTHQVILPAMSDSVKYSLTTLNDDNIDVIDRVVNGCRIKLFVRIIGGVNYANIDPGPGAQIGISQERNKISNCIYDNDGLPEVAVRVDQTNTALKRDPVTNALLNEIDEGDVAKFELTTSVQAAEDRLINIIVDTGSGDFVSGPIPSSVTIAKNTTRAIIPAIQTINDNVFEADNHITISIAEDNNSIPAYTVDPTGSRATIIVQDNDPTDGLRIIATDSSFSEGEFAEFQIAVDVAPTSTREFNLLISSTGNFIQDTGANIEISRTIFMLPNTTRVTFRELVVQDISNEPNATLTAKLTGESTCTDINGVFKAQCTSTVAILDDDNIPAISVTAGANVVEGQTAIFSFSSIATSSEDTGFVIMYSDPSSFIDTTSSDWQTGLGENNTKIINLPANQSRVNLFISTIDNTIYELDDEITVTILPDPAAIDKYIINPQLSATASVTIYDNDIPTISLSADSTSIVEGESVTITLLSSDVILSNTTVWLSVIEDNGDFIHGVIDDVPKTMAPTLTAQRVIETNDDTIDEMDGSFKVRVLEDPLYLDRYLGFDETTNPNGEITINVADNDEPLITISAVAETVTEGEPAQFILSADQVIESQLKILVSVTEEKGDFLTESVPKFQDMQVQERSVILTIQTKDDDIDESDGLIRVALGIGANYKIPAHTDSGSYAEVRVQDNENTSLSLSADQNTVVEGEVITFTITANPAPATAIEVQFTVNEDGTDFIQGETVPVELTIPAGIESISRPVSTFDDQINEANGSITARIALVAGSTSVYSIPAGENSLTVVVLDNDAPVISITTALNSIVEGQNAEFSLHSSVSLYTDLTINLLVSQGDSNFLRSTTALAVDFGQGLTELPIVIETIDDDEDEMNGQITLEITMGTNYQAAKAPDNLQTINIIDNDLPEVTITTNKNSIIEGETTTFIIASTTPHSTSIMVNLNVDESGSFISGAKPTTEIIPPNTRSQEIKISTTNDNEVELNGRITVTVLSGTDYTTKSPTNEDFVNVADNDLEISLVPLAISTVEEGSDVIFEFRSSQPIITSKVVNILITETGSFLQSLKPTTHEITSLPSSRYLTLSTIEDSVDEADGTISIQLLTGSDYSVGSLANLSLNVIDNDISEISITANTNSVFEGDVIEFKIAGDLERTRPIDVKVEVSQVGNFLATAPGIRTVSLEVGSNNTSSMLIENTQRISGIDQPGSVTARLVLNSPAEYQIDGAKNQVSVTVTENSTPLIFVKAGEKVDESQVAQYKIYSDIARSNPLEINYIVDDGDSNFLAPTQLNTDSATLQAGDGGELGVTTTIDIRLHDDLVDELDGVVTVTIQPDSNTPVQYRPSFSNGLATINVTDNDQPEISIFSGDSISEGEEALFTLTASIVPVLELTINIVLTDEGEFLNENSAVKEVTFPINSPNQTVEFSVKTQRKGQSTNQSGRIIATIEAGLGYVVSGNRNQATVEVNEPADLLISITGATRINEGELAIFKFGVSSPLSEPVVVNIAVADPGNYILGQVNTTQQLTSDPNSLALNILTHDDQTRGQNSTIAVSILGGGGYRVGTPSSALTHVIDNDSISISIVAEESSTVEGTAAKFKFSSNLVVDKMIELNFEVQNEVGDFIALYFFENIPDISFAIGDNEKLLEVPTVDDSFYAENGIVVVSILSGEHYAADPSSSTAYTEIVDNDTPLVSITAVSSVVNEGSVASFQLVASNEGLDNRQIHIQINDPFNTIAGERPETVMLERFQMQTLLQLGTVDNDWVVLENVITVTIMSNELYRIDESSRTAQVSIMDNDTDWQEVTESRLNKLNNSIMPSMLRAKQSNKINLLTARIENAFEVIEDPIFELNNQQTLPEIFTLSGNAINEEKFSLTELLANSKFSLTTFPGSNESNPATLWASVGEFRVLKAGDEKDLIQWEGNVQGIQFGFDSYFNEKFLLGLGLTYFQGGADYRGSDEFGYFEGEHQNWSMGLQPFVAFRPYGGNSEWWATAGFGQGELKIKHEDVREKVSYTQHFNTALGGRYNLVSYDSHSGRDQAELNLLGEVWTAQELIGGSTYYFEEKVVDVSRAKVQFDGSLWQDTESEIIQKPTFNLGVFWDWGDGETGMGIESGVGLFIEGIKYLTLELKSGFSLLLNDTFQDWYAQGLLRFDQYRDGLGVQVSTDANFGEDQINFLVEDNWIEKRKQSSDLQLQSNRFQFITEFSYGFEIFPNHGAIEPYLGYEFHQEVISAFKFGGRLRFGTNFQMGLEGRREEQFDGEVSYGASLNSTLKW